MATLATLQKASPRKIVDAVTVHQWHPDGEQQVYITRVWLKPSGKIMRKARLYRGEQRVNRVRKLVAGSLTLTTEEYFNKE